MEKQMKIKWVALLLASAGMLSLLAPLATCSENTWLNIPPCDDAYVKYCHIPENYGSEPTLYVGLQPPIAMYLRRTYIRFNLAEYIPKGAHFLSSELYLITQSSGVNSNPFTISAHHVEDHDWDEHLLIWPGKTYEEVPTSSITSTFTTIGQAYWWHVNQDVAEDFYHGDYTSFVMKRDDESTTSYWVGFNSKEATSGIKPYLHIGYKFLFVPSDYPTIQQAIDVAQDGNIIFVTPGEYHETIDFKGKAITLRSDVDADPLTYDVDPEITVIDGDQTGTVVTFKSGEGADSLLDGFTIANGRAETGGGIRCIASSSPTIQNNIIVDNTATADFGGGGIFCSGASPCIMDNQIIYNIATVSGGGIRLESSNSLIARNRIGYNEAEDGAGIVSHNWNGVLENNMIYQNSAVRNGGGVSCGYTSSPAITNNTIVYNYARDGGGIMFAANSNSMVVNTIIWGNNASQDNHQIAVYSSTPTVEYCDIEDGWSGEGNINQDPLFLNDLYMDYHLTSVSPCVSAGDNNAPNLPATDFEGDPRIAWSARGLYPAKIVDIGADEDFTCLMRLSKRKPMTYPIK